MSARGNESGYNPEKDPNYHAYSNDLNNGVFTDLDPTTFVAYCNGTRIGTGTDRDELIAKIIAEPQYDPSCNPLITTITPREPRLLNGKYFTVNHNVHR